MCDPPIDNKSNREVLTGNPVTADILLVFFFSSKINKILSLKNFTYKVRLVMLIPTDNRWSQSDCDSPSRTAQTTTEISNKCSTK